MPMTLRLRVGLRSWGAASATAIVLAGLLTASSASADTVYAEQQGSHGVDTFTNYHNASGVGPRIAAGAWVDVSCKVYDPFIGSANPDGYWYRVASSPWNNAYYAPANTFMNGDPWGGPYTHNTDFNVPDCGAVPAPSPSVQLAQGPVAPFGYRYAVTLSNFAPNASIGVDCYDSASPGGFYHFALTTNGSGSANTESQCYSADGPDHWVVAGGVESNHVQWGGSGGGTPPPSAPITPPVSTTPPAPTAPSFAARRCAADSSGNIVSSLGAVPWSDPSGYRISIIPGPKGRVSWYASNSKIVDATNDMWNIITPCLSSFPLKFTGDQSKSLYFQLECHFYDQRFIWLPFNNSNFGAGYDLETGRSASVIPSDKLGLQRFFLSTRCNW